MDETITKIIDYHLDIKLGQFTQEELNVVLTKIKNKKAAGFDEILPEIWKTRKFNDVLVQYYITIYNQNTIDKWIKSCILPFHKRGDLKNAKNYRVITFTPIAARIYNALLLNHIEPEIEKILRKNQNGFHRNWSTTSQIPTIKNLLRFQTWNLSQ